MQEPANESEKTSKLKKELQVEQMNDKNEEKDDNEHKEYVLPENSRLGGATSKSLGKPSSLTHNSEKPERKRMFSKMQKQQEMEAVRTKDKKPENKENNKIVYAEEEKRPPEPEVKRIENDMVVKNTITAEENARNIAMLKDIENQYMDARNLIDQMSDSSTVYLEINLLIQ